MIRANPKIYQYIFITCVLYIFRCDEVLSEFELLNKPNPKGSYGNSLPNGIKRNVT